MKILKSRYIWRKSDNWEYFSISAMCYVFHAYSNRCITVRRLNMLIHFSFEGHCPPKHQTLKNTEAVFQKYNLQICTSVSILIVIFSIHFLWYESFKVIMSEKHWWSKMGMHLQKGFQLCCESCAFEKKLILFNFWAILRIFKMQGS